MRPEPKVRAEPRTFLNRPSMNCSHHPRSIAITSTDPRLPDTCDGKHRKEHNGSQPCPEGNVANTGEASSVTCDRCHIRVSYACAGRKYAVDAWPAASS